MTYQVSPKVSWKGRARHRVPSGRGTWLAGDAATELIAGIVGSGVAFAQPDPPRAQCAVQGHEQRGQLRRPMADPGNLHRTDRGEVRGAVHRARATAAPARWPTREKPAPGTTVPMTSIPAVAGSADPAAISRRRQYALRAAFAGTTATSTT